MTTDGLPSPAVQVFPEAQESQAVPSWPSIDEGRCKVHTGYLCSSCTVMWPEHLALCVPGSAAEWPEPAPPVQKPPHLSWSLHQPGTAQIHIRWYKKHGARSNQTQYATQWPESSTAVWAGQAQAGRGRGVGISNSRGGGNSTCRLFMCSFRKRDGGLLMHGYITCYYITEKRETPYETLSSVDLQLHCEASGS